MQIEKEVILFIIGENNILVPTFWEQSIWSIPLTH